MRDDLGDRMKMYEAAESGRRFMPLVPIIARLDGRCFSAFTRGMERPFDRALAYAMHDTTEYLVRESEACCGYTQSDEITLAWYSMSAKSQVFFDGRIQKMVSVLASACTGHFTAFARECLPGKSDSLPMFDCRAWPVPTLQEATNAFLWREWDATKNAISSAASAHYSHRELCGKNGRQKQEMLHAKGVNFNDYPAWFRHGLWVVRRRTRRTFTAAEIEQLPAQHEARSNPDLVVERQSYERHVEPRLSQILNGKEFLFGGAEPMPVADHVAPTAGTTAN